MGSGSNGYTLKVSKTERVVAASPMPEQWLAPSNFDLLLPPIDVNIFFCYKASKPNPPFADKVAALKESLAHLLVTYYPFAGEVVASPSGEPELHCNNRGVDFTEAHADVELAELHFGNMDKSVVDNQLVAKKDGGVLCVQATELKCGGLVLACTFEHSVADGYTTNRFMVAWGETARSKPVTMVPSFRRSLVYPRRPGRYDAATLNRLFVPLSSLPPPPPPPAAENPEEAVNRMYYVTAAELSRLQAAAKSSKLEALAAFLWGVLAGGAKRRGARTCSMGIAVDGRYRLGGGAMAGYFGNVLSIPFDTMAVEELEGMEAAAVAERVHGCVKVAGTEEHFRGVVDWVEERRPAPAGARIYFPGAEGVGEVAAVVSSGRGFPVADVEFPWGRPVFGSPMFLWGAGTGHIMPMPSPAVDGDWVVYVHILKGLVDVIEEVAGDVLRPVTPEYLNLVDSAAAEN